MGTYAQGTFPSSEEVQATIKGRRTQLDLPGEYSVSATFNVPDLSPFDADIDSRTNPFEEGGNDTNIGETSSEDQELTPEPDSEGVRATPIPENYQGPITRARLRRLQETIESIKGTKSDLPARQTLKNLSIICHKPDIEGTDSKGLSDSQ